MTALETSNKFKVKGTSLLNLKKYIVRQLGEEFFLEVVRGAGINSEIILASSWYPMDAYQYIADSASKSMDVTLNRFMFEVGRSTIEIDLRGIYKLFMKTTGARNVLGTIPKMSKVYSNCIEINIIQNEDGLFVVQYLLPLKHAEWQSAGSKGGIAGILNTCKRPMKSFEIINEESISMDEEDFIQFTFQIKY